MISVIDAMKWSEIWFSEILHRTALTVYHVMQHVAIYALPSARSGELQDSRAETSPAYPRKDPRQSTAWKDVEDADERY